MKRIEKQFAQYQCINNTMTFISHYTCLKDKNCNQFSCHFGPFVLRHDGKDMIGGTIKYATHRSLTCTTALLTHL